MQDQTGQFPYTRTFNFGSDLARFTGPIPDKTYIYFLVGGRFYLDCAEFFDKRDAVDFVQGRNTGENLVQG